VKQMLVRLAVAVSLFSGAAAAHAADLTGGTTTVAFDSSFVNFLMSAGISPSAIAPSPSLGVFPITANTAETISHSGGILFSGMSSGSAATLAISDFVINLGAGDVTGDAVADGKNLGVVPLFTLEPPSAGATADLDLTSTAIGAIDSVFGTSVSTSAVVPVGAATVRGPAAGVPEPSTLAMSVIGLFGLALARRRWSTAQARS
jgi:hypothetical protein